MSQADPASTILPAPATSKEDIIGLGQADYRYAGYGEALAHIDRELADIARSPDRGNMREVLRSTRRKIVEGL